MGRIKMVSEVTLVYNPKFILLKIKLTPIWFHSNLITNSIELIWKIYNFYFFPQELVGGNLVSKLQRNKQFSMNPLQHLIFVSLGLNKILRGKLAYNDKDNFTEGLKYWHKYIDVERNPDRDENYAGPLIIPFCLNLHSGSADFEKNLGPWKSSSMLRPGFVSLNYRNRIFYLCKLFMLIFFSFY